MPKLPLFLKRIVEILSSRWFWIIVAAGWIELNYVFLALNIAWSFGIHPWIALLTPLAVMVIVAIVQDEKRIQKRLQQELYPKVPDFEKALEGYVKSMKEKKKGDSLR